MTLQEEYNRTTRSLPSAGPWNLQRLQDAVLVIGTGLDLKAMLQRIVEAAVDLVEARSGAIGILDESGQLAEFVTVDLDNGTHASFGDLPKGLGLLGSLIFDATPLRAALFREHPDSAGFRPDHRPVMAFLRVPMLVRGEVFANLYLTNKATGEGFTDVDEELSCCLAAAAGVAIDNARLYERSRLREAATVAIKEVATAVLAGADERSSLKLVAKQARQLLTAELAIIALPDPNGHQLVIEIADGPIAEAVQGECFVAAGTIAGEVFSTGEPAVIDDVSRGDLIRPDQLRAGEFGPGLFVALMADGQPFGTLTVARAEGAAPFTPAEFEVAQYFATQASVVLEQERVRQHRQRLMLVDDQERIGRDLHDTVVQRLFATALSLKYAVPRIADPDVQQRVSGAIDELDRTIGHIRTVIFDIDTSNRDPATSVRAQVLELTHDAARGLGFQPRIVFRGTVDTTVGRQLITDLLATVQEVLSNVVRHAAASRVDLELSVNDAVTLRVVDDGTGISGDSQRGGGHGIVNMRARAEHLGGTFDVIRPASGGTEVCWQVPLLLSQPSTDPRKGEHL